MLVTSIRNLSDRQSEEASKREASESHFDRKLTEIYYQNKMSDWVQKLYGANS